MLTTITSRTRDLIDLPPDVLDLTLECGKLESFLLHAGVLRVETFQHFVQLDLEDRGFPGETANVSSAPGYTGNSDSMSGPRLRIKITSKKRTKEPNNHVQETQP